MRTDATAQPEAMATEDFVDVLQGLLDGDLDTTDLDVELRAATFRGAGVLTSNDGLVVTLSDGSEFQVTVVRSR